MKNAIEARELIVVDGLDFSIRGTYHKVCNDNSETSPTLGDQARVGVMILNSMSPTRAANGDAAVSLAESFRRCGYSTFRIDLPGFGDSAGDPPADLLGFINKGGYASVASECVKELTRRFNLSGIILVGHCAGSVSALYTAAISAECRGLVLIGPYFHLPQVRKQSKFRGQLNRWALQGNPGRILNKAYGALSELRNSLRLKAVPRNANSPLLRSWKKVATAGLPILILKKADRKGPVARSSAAEFDYFRYLARLAGRRSQVTVEVTDGANNAFANRAGLAGIRQQTEQWLKTHFPVTLRKESSVAPLSLDPGDVEDVYAFTQECSELPAGKAGR